VTKVEVKGLKELRDVLTRKLPIELQGKPVQNALSKAARPIVREARRLAPERTGRLKRAIYSFRSRASTRTRQSRLIGVRSGKRFKGKDAFYWKWVEFGRGAVTRKRGVLGTPSNGFFGREVKAVPARPFLRPAFQSQKERSVEEFRRSLAPEIEKAAKKYRVNP
jgi:HK97 gp10 family phage protein